MEIIRNSRERVVDHKYKVAKYENKLSKYIKPKNVC